MNNAGMSNLTSDIRCWEVMEVKIIENCEYRTGCVFTEVCQEDDLHLYAAACASGTKVS